MSNKKIIQGVWSYLNFMTKFTVRIISFKDNGDIGHRSGFLYQPDENDLPLIITAGHGCPKKGSFVETRILKDGRPLCYNAGEFKVFITEGAVDLAYSKIPVDIIRKDLSFDQSIEHKAYKDKFYVPSRGTAYGFAVLNNYEATEENILPQYCCYEVGMELHSMDH